MKKNEVIRETISSLMEQRRLLVESLSEVNFNDNNSDLIRNSLEMQIQNIDNNVSSYMLQLEYQNF